MTTESLLQDDQQRAAASAGTTQLLERAIVLLLFGGLLIGVLAVLRPFVTAVLFGAILAIAAWPVRNLLLSRGLGRRLTATLLFLVALAIIVLPVIAVAPRLAEHLMQGIQNLQIYLASDPELPRSLARLPLVGQRLANFWEEATHTEGGIRAVLEPYSATLQHGFVLAARELAESVLQIVISLAVAAMFWVSGDIQAVTLRDILRRLGGDAAAATLDVVAGAVRGVAYGVVGTAAIQAVVLTIGLGLAGVPGAVLLGFVTLLLALSQVGAPLIVLVWAGAATWQFSHGEQGWAIFLIAWGLGVSTMDNVIKPWLIGFGLRMPLGLIILGVFGGFMAFGFLGLFIGPTLIAVAFTLLNAWRHVRPRASQSPAE
jgi:predicted PurR-regulated permease PerM